MSFKFVEESKLLPGVPAGGQTIRFRAVALFWWEEEEVVGDGDRHGEGAITEKVWKIVKCHDYGELLKDE